jgi:hypothetical protein
LRHSPHSTLQEFSLSAGFTAVGILHLVPWLAQIARNPALGWHNWEWSAVMSGGYLLAGTLFFYSALGQWLRNRRRTASDSGTSSMHNAASGDSTRSRIVRFQTKHPPST